MRTRSTMVAVGVAAVAATVLGCSKPSPAANTKKEGGVSTTTTTDSSMLDFTMNRIDGAPEALSAFKGKVVLIVNTASECGLTPQYAGLETLYKQKQGEGFVVLGFPANDFMGQEPGTNAEIAKFCTTKYSVTFPMFQKVTVTGSDACELYQRLSAASEAPTWNFTKYLLDREGRLVKRFGPRTSPNDPELIAEIDRLLSAG